MASTSAERVSLTAPDISCEHCVSSIQQAVGELQGVESVSASEQTRVVDVRFDPSLVTVDRIRAVLDDAGYPVQP